MGLLPAAPLIRSDDHLIKYYSTDASGHMVRPSGVAHPRSHADVIDIIEHGARTRTPITARGAGTGLAGGALGDGIILDTSCMNDILYRDGIIRVEPGVRLGTVTTLLHEYNRILGPDPSVGPFCSIGGMVATNASGSLSLMYGSILDNLESVVIIDGRGRTIHLPDDRHVDDMICSICASARPFPRTTKNSCGYRLDAAMPRGMSHKVVAASEGTLGIIVEARLRTHPAPLRRVCIAIEYGDGRAAAVDCTRIVECGPAALEITGPGMMDGYGDACVLFAEFHDIIQSHAYDMIQNAAPGRMAMSVADDRWRSVRAGALARSLRTSGDGFPSIIEDATVPLARLPDLFNVIHELGVRTCTKPAYYGHAGNGNIHVRAPADDNTARWYLEKVVSMGGTITGEHGDGSGRAAMVLRQYGMHNYGLFGKLKDLFDPYNIMNPGKVLGTPWK